jgi:hypothetical protein
MEPSYWARFGQISAVDWCEPNYLHSPYVAEWWNTLSSVPIALIGLLGLWQTRGHLRFAVGYLRLSNTYQPRTPDSVRRQPNAPS